MCRCRNSLPVWRCWSGGDPGLSGWPRAVPRQHAETGNIPKTSATSKLLLESLTSESAGARAAPSCVVVLITDVPRSLHATRPPIRNHPRPRLVFSIDGDCPSGKIAPSAAHDVRRTHPGASLFEQEPSHVDRVDPPGRSSDSATRTSELPARGLVPLARAHHRYSRPGRALPRGRIGHMTNSA